MIDQPDQDNSDPNRVQVPARDERLRLQPVSPEARIEAVDYLRGFALLGILVINIGVLALPASTLFNPVVAGGFKGLNLVTWEVSYLVFFQKMMAIFSMLFGAGVILMSDRAAAAGRRFVAIYYRRILWLALFGLLHAYLLWYGDILFPYALAGIFLYPLRKVRGKFLMVLGVIVLLIGFSLQFGAGMMFDYMRTQARAAESAIEAGKTPNQQQQMMSEVWSELNVSFDPPAEKLSEEIEALRGGYWEMVKYRAPYTLMMQVQAVPFSIFWRVLAFMLLGMGLMKLQVFSARRSSRFYLILMIIGYCAGFSLTGYGMARLLAEGFDFVFFFKSGGLYDYIGSAFVSLGHVGLLMTVFRSNILQSLKRRLAAVGRMALTNYLMHTVICAIVFFGFGFGLFNEIERFGLIWVVFGIWALQLIVSPIWLKRFRFGPAEWLWRTLTYMRRQPMRV